MKLITKTNGYYFIFALIIFIIGGFSFYYILQSNIHTEIDEELSAEKEKIVDLAGSMNNQNFEKYLNDDQINFNIQSNVNGEYLYDSLINDKVEEESSPYRIYNFTVKNDNKIYNIVLIKSLIESENLIESIFYAILFLFLLMLVGIGISSHFITRKIWKPFYKTLQVAGKFKANNAEKIELPVTNISEFRQLNESFQNLFSKVGSEYKSLKDFSENASHEIQTPLAIILSQLEIFIQSENLNQEQINAVRRISDAASKLSKLNHALLLLMKIENSQFNENEKVDFTGLLNRKVDDLLEFISLKKIQISASIEDNVAVEMNLQLADMLITNLLSNAIKHNIAGGFIDVKLTQGFLEIKNSGIEYKGDTKKLFERFSKNDSSNDSIGLGLSIIDKICETSNFELNYTVDETVHIIKIKFFNKV